MIYDIKVGNKIVCYGKSKALGAALRLPEWTPKNLLVRGVERRSGMERAPERTPIARADSECYSENFVGARSGAALRFLPER